MLRFDKYVNTWKLSKRDYN